MICNICGLYIKFQSDPYIQYIDHNAFINGMNTFTSNKKKINWLLNWINYYNLSANFSNDYNNFIPANEIQTLIEHHYPDIYNKLIKLLILQ
jgi:hypothetical protein